MKTLILVGGGHAHLYVIKKLKKALKTKVNVILISAMEKQYYSGMASGSLEGYYSEEEMTVDLESYCQKHAIHFIKSSLVSIDPVSNLIVLSDGQEHHYDYISFNTGSIARRDLLIDESNCFYVKPLNVIHDIKESVLNLCQENKSSEMIKIVVVGTGAAGIEMGFAAKNLIESNNKKAHLLFVSSSHHVLKGLPDKAKSYLFQNNALTSDVEWLLNDAGLSIEANSLLLKSGKKRDFDIAMITTGIKGSEIFETANLSVDKSNFMKVNDCLQNESYANILGAGDCVTIHSEMNIPKNGVYAIKEAKVLSQNIENLLSEKALVSFKAQKKFLSIIALKKGTAILTYASFAWTGKIPFMLKQWIDQKYMLKLKR